MDLKLTCRHCEVSDELRQYIDKRTERVRRHFDGVHDVELVLDMDGSSSRVEMIVGAVRGQKCVAEAKEQDVFAAVDQVVDKMVRQLRKLKGKLRERHGKGPEEGPEAPEVQTPAGRS